MGVWKYTDSYVVDSDSLSLPERVNYFSDKKHMKQKETFDGKSAWVYDYGGDMDIAVFEIPRYSLVEPWMAIVTQEEIFFHCILADVDNIRSIEDCDENPLLGIYRIYSNPAFFTKKKGESKYRLMMPDEMVDFCETCMCALSPDSFSPSFKDFKDIRFPYTPEMLLDHFTNKIDFVTNERLC